MHDKAFDKGYFTITADFRVIFSRVIGDFEKDDSVAAYFVKYEGAKIQMPEKFIPDEEFLEYHREEVFKR